MKKVKPYSLSVNQFKQKLLDDFGHVSEILVKEYAEARYIHRKRLKEDFNPFTDDPGCKTCGKKKRAKFKK
jgi:hypothetical protein